MSYQDRTLTCSDCGTPFVFTASEQAFYAERGFANEPKRCPSCRQARKGQRGDGGYGGGRQSGGYGYDDSGHSGGYGGGGYGGGGQRSYGGGQRAMHTVTCADCGREAQVPFVPRGDRPVYCSDCFGKHRGGGYR